MREELKNMSEIELNQLEEQVAEEAVTVEHLVRRSITASMYCGMTRFLEAPSGKIS